MCKLKWLCTYQFNFHVRNILQIADNSQDFYYQWSSTFEISFEVCSTGWIFMHFSVFRFHVNFLNVLFHSWIEWEFFITNITWWEISTIIINWFLIGFLSHSFGQNLFHMGHINMYALIISWKFLAFFSKLFFGHFKDLMFPWTDMSF